MKLLLLLLLCLEALGSSSSSNNNSNSNSKCTNYWQRVKQWSRYSLKCDDSSCEEESKHPHAYVGHDHFSFGGEKRRATFGAEVAGTVKKTSEKNQIFRGKRTLFRRNMS